MAIANAHRAYGRYRERFADGRWLALRDAGARSQRPLWASTGTKDDAYSDVLYVEELVAPEVVNTMPEATLRAFADHGDATRVFDWSADVADQTLARLGVAGLELASITAELERAGVEAFCDSYKELIHCVEAKLRQSAARGDDTLAAERWSDEGGHPAAPPVMRPGATPRPQGERPSP